MSYDLMVFDPGAAPRKRSAFAKWYRDQVEWNRGYDYTDPGGTVPALRAWFMEMIETFPAMNGPFRRQDEPSDQSLVTDYDIGPSSIYVGFAWSKAEQAYRVAFRLAGKHSVGFYDVSSYAGEIWLPSGNGRLVLSQPQK